jgi:hypothetical protein
MHFRIDLRKMHVGEAREKGLPPDAKMSQSEVADRDCREALVNRDVFCRFRSDERSTCEAARRCSSCRTESHYEFRDRSDRGSVQWSLGRRLYSQ